MHQYSLVLPPKTKTHEILLTNLIVVLANEGKNQVPAGDSDEL